MKLINLIFTILLLNTYAHARDGYLDASYIITCIDKNNPYHLAPLSFLEFEGEFKIPEIINGSNKNIISVAPKRLIPLFKNFDSMNFIQMDWKPLTRMADIDPLLYPPSGCKIVSVLMDNMGDDLIRVNTKYWNKLRPAIQRYLLADLFVMMHFLDMKLSGIDTRRFTIYTYSNSFKNLSTEQKAFFLQYYNIMEMEYSEVSIDLAREIEYYENSSSIKHAWPAQGWKWNGKSLDPAKKVSFYKTGELKSIAPLDPFKRIIHGQEFYFFNDPEDTPRYGMDETTSPRVEFYKNGMVAEGHIKRIKYFLDIIYDIKWKFFGVKRYYARFYENGDPKYINIDEGKMIFEGKEKRVNSIDFFRNFKFKSLYFIDGTIIHND